MGHTYRAYKSSFTPNEPKFELFSSVSMKGMTYVMGLAETLCILTIYAKNMQIRLIFIKINLIIISETSD